ncbi:hypothetical protein BKA93DRAFT_827131 [Sparassis latifolia]|uniref:Nucleolar protein 12 n=1 Tax=Sparassis crispa TaxID=139825 RepID=A0A401GRM9_9APHY|nr:hypothetical protein SCP_0700430 [Sparassis crispa]GBE84863.1 hypothetical protein SCP_0700430 [Sparassis crispa]
MSLSSFLISAHEKNSSKKGKEVVLDKRLDDIFHSSTGASQTDPSTDAQPINVDQSKLHGSSERGKRVKKRKLQDAGSTKSKRSKGESEKETVSENPAPGGERSRARSVAAVPEAVSEDDHDQDSPTVAGQKHGQSSSTSRNAEVSSNVEDSQSENEDLSSRLLHESLSKESQSKQHGRTRTKHVPPDETMERRNARTIFVGNVPVEVAKSRSLQKQFKRYILSFVPTAKVESMRFRSVAFQKPTSQLPALTDMSSDKFDTKGKTISNKDGRQHDRDRAAFWRASKGQHEEEARKTYLTPKEKKRIAFIKHEIHEGVDAVNAYVVFAHAPPSTAARVGNMPPSALTMDPYEAAKTAAELCDGTVFMERTLRADRVGRDSEHPGKNGDIAGDPKTTVFVGNLDFASKEEDLRVFFEALVSAERGPPPEGGDSGEEDEEDEDEDTKIENARTLKPRTWVKRVRIIRDQDTQLGKGFAYVQFIDRECVDEILALEQDRLKFAKRKLRAQRCKIPPGSKVTTRPARPLKSSTASSSVVKHPGTAQARTAPAPRGDPTLGTKISHLSKDERKHVKAADPDRVARRLAKKKAKALAEKGVKVKIDRERVRKRAGEKKAPGALQEKVKRRVRSGRALAKMNTKK